MWCFKSEPQVWLRAHVLFSLDLKAWIQPPDKHCLARSGLSFKTFEPTFIIREVCTRKMRERQREGCMGRASRPSRAVWGSVGASSAGQSTALLELAGWRGQGPSRGL